MAAAVVVIAEADEPLREGRKQPLYLIRGAFPDAKGRNLTPALPHADRFLSEISAGNVARRMGLTKFRVEEVD